MFCEDGMSVTLRLNFADGENIQLRQIQLL